MSNPKAFRFSPEVLAILEAQPDQKKYIEDLVLKKTPITGEPYSSVPSENRISYLLSQQTQEILAALKEIKPPTGAVATVVSDGYKKGDIFQPKPPDPLTGYDCCERKTPCKHWVWDMNKTGYTNSLTGAFKEPEI